MKKKAFTQWLQGVGQLSSQQLASLKTAIEQASSADAVSQTLNQEVMTTCPHCASEALQKFGIKNDLQRYRCKACQKTFNRLTGTPLARLRKKKQWLGVLDSLSEEDTLDSMQERLAISRPTAVRWRRRFLKALQPGQNPTLGGIVEADETYIRRGQKGTLCQDRAPRKRGEPAQYGGTHPDEYVCLLTARDRHRNSANQVARSQKTPVFQEFLAPLIAEDSILCSDGHAGYTKFAQSAKIQHVVLNAKRKEFVKASVYHIQNVNAYHSRLKQFLSKRKGVSAKNLELYVGWLDHLEKLSNLPEPLNPRQVLQTYILHL